MARLITEPVRISYAHINEPKIDDKGNERYSCMLLIPKEGNAIEPFKAVVEKAIAEGLASGKITKVMTKKDTFKMPIKDGDTVDPEERHYDTVKGFWFINAGAYKQPGCVDRLAKPIDPSEIYSGCHCRIDLGVAVFNHEQNKGVGCYCNNIMFHHDGERLDGQQSAESAFAAYAEEEGEPFGANDDEDFE